MENNYRLVIPYEYFEDLIRNSIKSGEKKIATSSTSTLKELTEEYEVWKKETKNKIISSFQENEHNLLIEIFNRGGLRRFRIFDIDDEIVVMKKPTIKEKIEDWEFKIKTLQEILRYSMVSDLMQNSDGKIISYETIEEKRILILSKLRELNDGNYHHVELLLALNGVFFKHKDEEIEFVEMLVKSGYVDNNSRSSNEKKIRITAKGQDFIEKKIKAQTKATDSKKATSSKNDEYKRVCKKIDEVLQKLKEQELKMDVGHQILFEEIEELKELYLKLNKKNWRQIVVGKLTDLAIGKMVENDTVKFVYENITGKELKLIN